MSRKPDLADELTRLRKLLANYEELEAEMADEACYVARGNGFCDTKFSEAFVEGQQERLRRQIAALERMSESQGGPIE
ncbi:MAG: hypothetical protein AUK63_297 [bacterium P3]|nr:MAG: hypothetical protein AUK63_297 [bacterium P3]KWW42742.1 MAG: hypothetical protein F083_146 [bacterium F083]